MRALAFVCVLAAAAPAGAQEAELARAKKIVAGSCFLCHGMQGESATELFPRLAAQNEKYIAKQLANFKSGERKSEVMPRMVGALTPEDMRALGLYFSRQASRPHPPTDASLAAQGMVVYRQGGAATEAAACVGCHGERGHGSESLPRLAGQVASYLATQLRNFGARVRTNDNAVMHTIAAKMTDGEIRAVSEYLSGLE
ncbi:MAG: c-type cytochrome [Betaproteobacteria bacterium]|nr:c-type cytochrome [Betaproteobacteria bacterium]MDH5219660.1 c-type cytochrome [Betaproteobacteria bacterium]MDH5349627.1 c-type cytochrome [Betaproteobacteria bacterium]